jgi:glycerol-3-phosphate acyltransferase PlsX
MNAVTQPFVESSPFVPVIGVDLAGADSSERTLFEACLQAVSPLFRIRCYVSSPLTDHSAIDTVVCEEPITMDDDPLVAVRHKQSSSLVRAVQDLHSSTISALITCANTGAVTAASSIFLKRFVHHPALIAELPTSDTPIVALDMGAFTCASSKDLITNAYLGAAYAKKALRIKLPRVGLLNIGKEASRGPPELREANNYLRTHESSFFSYAGNIEPVDVFSHAIDVLVTSGFCGNIFLKTAEEVARLHPNAKEVSSKGGALLAGVKGTIFKCHGGSSPQIILTTIQQAYAAVIEDLAHSLELFFLTARPSIDALQVPSSPQ